MPRTSTGCWTCRLRRKKCDETRPACGGCSGLDISCHYGAEKPEWMDSGRRQRDMVRSLREEVKRGSERRRGRRLLRNIPREVVDEARETSLSLRQHSSPPNNGHALSFSEERGAASSTTGVGITENSSNSPSVSTGLSPAAGYTHPTPPVPGLTPDTIYTDPAAPPRNEFELSLTMVYLDYVFPILFPFYRPSLPQGGRAWLLVLSHQHDALHHIITGLTSYFLSVVRVASDPGYLQCTAYTWGELQKQTDLTVKVVQRDLQMVNLRGVDADLVGSTRLLTSIVHLLNLETIISPLGSWRIHLDAAVELFQQIFRHHGISDGSTQATLSTVLDKMGYTSRVTTPEGESAVFSSDQSAFRFFCAILLFQDIVSSTSLEHPPQLRTYHQGLLTDNPSSGGKVPLDLEEFIGCQNWVLMRISDIAALDVWKKEMKQAGALSIKQLAHKAAAIEEELDEALSKIEGPDALQRVSTTPWIFTILSESRLDHVGPRESNIAITTTRIWAYAARLYLNIVLSGWQPGDSEVVRDVAYTIDLLLGLPSAGWLRSLVWPVCVVGCLAGQQQEATFRDMVSSMKGLESFGTMRVALDVMESVWKKRGVVEADWDLAACFRELGNRVLLI